MRVRDERENSVKEEDTEHVGAQDGVLIHMTKKHHTAVYSMDVFKSLYVVDLLLKALQ